MLGSRLEFIGLQVRKHTTSYQRDWGSEAMLRALLFPTPRPHLPMGLQSLWDASGSWNLGRAPPGVWHHKEGCLVSVCWGYSSFLSCLPLIPSQSPRVFQSFQGGQRRQPLISSLLRMPHAFSQHRSLTSANVLTNPSCVGRVGGMYRALLVSWSPL